jgi:hypothetical protein
VHTARMLQCMLGKDHRITGKAIEGVLGSEPGGQCQRRWTGLGGAGMTRRRSAGIGGSPLEVEAAKKDKDCIVT